MKYNSTAIDPNGKRPAMSIAGTVLKYHGWEGICLGIWFVLTGTENTDLLDCQSEPTIDKGTEMANHMRIIAAIVPTGIAPEELA